MAFSNPASSFKDGIPELHRTLDALAQRYLDGSNSIYMLYLTEITPPEPSDLSDRSDDLEKSLHSFLMKSLIYGRPVEFGHVRIPDESRQPPSRSGEVIPVLKRDELAAVFAETILRFLQPYDPSVYALTVTGWDKYKALLKPVVCLGMTAVSVKDEWFMLVAEWSD